MHDSVTYRSVFYYISKNRHRTSVMSAGRFHCTSENSPTVSVCRVNQKDSTQIVAQEVISQDQDSWRSTKKGFHPSVIKGKKK